jgi:sarcosine oxidase subunit gamma
MHNTVSRYRLKDSRQVRDDAVHFLGHDLPAQVGTILSGAVRIFCLGPGEWLAEMSTKLDEGETADLAAQGVVAVDLTDGLAVLDLQGDSARDILAKGCGLDIGAKSFLPGRCARTRFTQVAVLIECVDAAAFRLYVSRSYAHYLGAWLADAAVEYSAT